MRLILAFLFIITLYSLSSAQTTAIPDPNFEQKLINSGLDATLDGSVITANIDTLKHLSVPWGYINDLTGIEDFSSLTKLDCYNNNLTSLNLSQNQFLTYLQCHSNNINSIDVSQNILLSSIMCEYNNLTTIDLSQNINLETVNIDYNQLTELDLTSNSALIMLTASHNNLTCLNIKNGNNPIITNVYLINNPNLTCIDFQPSWSTTANEPLYLDPQMYFSTNCPNSCLVGVNKNILSNISIYPNPTTNAINIDLGSIKQGIQATLINILGETTLTQPLGSTSIVSIDIDAPSGIYFLRIETANGESKTLKVLKE